MTSISYLSFVSAVNNVSLNSTTAESVSHALLQYLIYENLINNIIVQTISHELF